MFHEVQRQHVVVEFTVLDPRHCRYPNSKTWGGFSWEESLCCCSWALACDNLGLHPVQAGRQTGGRQKKRLRQRRLQAEERVCARCVFNAPFTRECAACLDVPRVCRDGVECERLGDLRRRHGTFLILFVGQNKNGRLLQVLRMDRRRHSWGFPHSSCATRTNEISQTPVCDTDVYLKMCWRNLKWNFLVLSRVRIIWSSPVIVKKSPPDLRVNLTIFGHMKLK